MKNLLLILFVFLFYQNGNSQNITGQILDASTTEPLIGATVSVDGTLLGTSTDIDGRFSLAVPSLPTVITISYLGFKNKKITIQNFNEKTIELAPLDEILPELIISDVRPIEKVFKKPYTVLDYEFYEDKILILVNRNFIKKRSLIVTNMEGEILKELKIKSWKPEQLFKGCLGGIHLITKGFARQIYIEGDEVKFLNQIDRRIFFAKFEPCVEANLKHVFYQKLKVHGQVIEYLIIEKRNPGEVKPYVKVVHETNVALWEDEASFSEMKAMVSAEHAQGQPAGSNFGDQGGETFREDILYDKIYAPIFEFQEKMYLFDHVHDEIQQLDMAGKVLKKASIEYHKTKKWRKEILFDKERGKAYTLFDTQWAIEITEINLETGELGEVIKLDRPHVSNIKIKDGYVYFLYYAPQHGVNIRRLEKMVFN
jgi:hypothetical protein